jgi:hypothetical protein
MNFPAYWAKLRATGWLDYVPAVRHAELHDQLEKNLANEGIRAAPYALATGTFDSADSSSDIVHQLESASHGVFVPTAIHVADGPDQSTLSFSHSGRCYSVSIPDGVVDWARFEAVMEIANHALADAAAPQRFRHMPGTSGGLVGIVCIPPDVFAKAQAAKLIPNRHWMNVCRVDPGDAARVAGLKKFPDRLGTMAMGEMNLDELAEVVKMLSDNPTATLHSVRTKPGARRTAFELREDVIPGSKLEQNEEWRYAGRWIEIQKDNDGLQEYLESRVSLLRKLAQQAEAAGQSLLVYF